MKCEHPSLYAALLVGVLVNVLLRSQTAYWCRAGAAAALVCAPVLAAVGALFAVSWRQGATPLLRLLFALLLAGTSVLELLRLWNLTQRLYPGAVTQLALCLLVLLPILYLRRVSAISQTAYVVLCLLCIATVGMLLRLVSERSRGLGRLVVSLLGFTWNIATFLVVPILAVEGIGPIQAIQRSTALLKKTWGEQIIGNFGVGAIFGLIVLGLILISLPIFYLLMIAETIWGVIALAVGLVLAFILMGLVQSTLNGIYTAAIYQYAIEERTGFFDEEMIRGAFVTRS